MILSEWSATHRGLFLVNHPRATASKPSAFIAALRASSAWRCCDGSMPSASSTRASPGLLARAFDDSAAALQARERNVGIRAEGKALLFPAMPILQPPPFATGKRHFDVQSRRRRSA
jgi:hypothetical protein